MAMDKSNIRKKYKKYDDFFKKESNRHTCSCGCEGVIELKKSHFWNGIPRFIFGHAAKLRVGTKKYDQDTYYSVEDIAQIASVSDQTVRLWNRHSKIKADKTIGRKNLYRKEAIHKFIENRPHRVPFLEKDYVTVQELKRMGISRSKLRALVRQGKIHEPRHYARKTHYLREEINTYLDMILEEIKPMRRRGRVSQAAIKKLKIKMRDLEQRIEMLESRL